MARARNIKPGFFKNELLVEMGAFDRLLFIGLWLLADREGRIEDRPKRIKLELFPCDTYDVDAGLTLLANAGFVKRYTINVKSIVMIENFHKHQTPHGSEKDSDLPDRDGNLTVNNRDSNGYITGTKRINASKSPLNVKTGTSNGGLQDEQRHLPVSNTLNPDSLNPDSLNPEVKAPRKRVASFDVKTIELPDWLNREDWELWCNAREEQKKPVGKLAAAQQIKKLAEYRTQGHTPKSVIEHSVAGSFQGLYAPTKPLKAAVDVECKEWYETSKGVEWKARELGIAKWDQAAEQWSQFRQRVMQAERDSHAPGISFDQLASLARQHQRAAA